jgi:hypothetical protein
MARKSMWVTAVAVVAVVVTVVAVLLAVLTPVLSEVLEGVRVAATGPDLVLSAIGTLLVISVVAWLVKTRR